MALLRGGGNAPWRRRRLDLRDGHAARERAQLRAAAAAERPRLELVLEFGCTGPTSERASAAPA